MIYTDIPAIYITVVGEGVQHWARAANIIGSRCDIGMVIIYVTYSQNSYELTLKTRPHTWYLLRLAVRYLWRHCEQAGFLVPIIALCQTGDQVSPALAEMRECRSDVEKGCCQDEG